jgi:hypothetical protein
MADPQLSFNFRHGSLRDPEFTCAFNVGSSITINVSLSALFNILFLCVDFNGDITWVGALNKPNKSACIGDTYYSARGKKNTTSFLLLQARFNYK